MFRCATAAVLAVLASVPFAPAADKAEKGGKAKKPAGAYTRTFGDFTVSFTFEADTLQVELAKNDGETVSVDAGYGVTRDGLLFGAVTQVEKKGTDAGPDKGDLFSFDYKVDGETLTISGLNSSKGVGDEARNLIEGEYRAKKTK